MNNDKAPKIAVNNNVTEYVDIGSYTSSYYTTPCPGYFFVSAEVVDGKNGEIHSANGSDTNYAWFKCANGTAQIIYVPKGVRLKTSNTQGVARFYKLNSYTK